MTRQEKADKIGEILDGLYPEPPIPLDHKDPYTLLVAVLLSAQCTDERVNQTTPTLFGVADNAADMATVPVDHIYDIIKPCGLGPQKSKAISNLSKILLDEHGGEVPETLVELEKLPGVGHKTASVVVAQAFGTPAFPVDTHIHRLANRWGFCDKKSTSATEKALKAVFPEDTWNRRHLQIIYFGRQYCPARSHDMRTCPICGWASTKKRIQEEELKNAKKPKAKGNKKSAGKK